MSENTTNKNVRNDEIDLLDLFQRMGRTLSRWGNSIVKASLISIVFIVKRWIPLSLSIVIGIGISYLSKTTTLPVYTSDLVIRNNLVSNADMISYLNRLHTYFLSGESRKLSDALKIPGEVIDEIQDVQAHWIISNKKEKIPLYVDYKNNSKVIDTSNIRMQDRMDIRLKSKSLVDLNIVREGVIAFINSDSLLQQKNRLRLKQNQELLARLNIDIIELDSLQKVKYFEETRNKQAQKGTQMIFLQQQNTQLVFNDIYNLYSRRQDIETQLNLYNEIVTILSDFSLPELTKDTGTIYGKKLVILLFILTLLVLVIIANRRKLAEIYNKY